MQEKPEKFGELAKFFRTQADLTIEEVAGKAEITDRYLYRIENEGKIPKFDVMCRLVSVLAIPGDYIFYPQSQVKDPEMEELVHMLYNCNKRSRKIMKSVLRALLEDQETEAE